MKMKFELVKRLETYEREKMKITFVFKPVDQMLKKIVSFKVTCVDPFDTMGNLGLPQSIGDTVMIETGAKEEQTRLSDIKEEEKQ